MVWGILRRLLIFTLSYPVTCVLTCFRMAPWGRNHERRRRRWGWSWVDSQCHDMITTCFVAWRCSLIVRCIEIAQLSMFILRTICLCIVFEHDHHRLVFSYEPQHVCRAATGTCWSSVWAGGTAAWLRASSSCSFLRTMALTQTLRTSRICLSLPDSCQSSKSAGICRWQTDII